MAKVSTVLGNNRLEVETDGYTLAKNISVGNYGDREGRLGPWKV